METDANLQPFLNIEERSGYHYYRMIITMKTIFVLYAIENDIPKTWSFHSMALCKIYITWMDPKMALVAYVGLVLNYFGLYFPQMAIMGMVAISYKTYECLLDGIVLLCLLYYAVESYETEMVKLITVTCISLTLGISAYMNYLQNTELFQIGVYFFIAILYLFSFIPLLPTRRKYRQRLMYVYLIQCAWIFYKAYLHCSDSKLLAVEIRNRTDVCMIVQRSYESDKCGLNETLENMEEFFIQSINMSNRRNYNTRQKVNLPVESIKEVANEKIANVNKLREYKLYKDVIFHMDADDTVRKISGVERQAAGETISKSIENAKTAQRYDSITEPDENQISIFDGKKSIFVKDNTNVEEKQFEELRHREENQLQSKINLEGNIKLTETRPSEDPVSASNVQSGSEITEPQNTGGKGEQIGNKATDNRNIEVGSLDETGGVTGNTDEVTKSAMTQFLVGAIIKAREMAATETQAEATDATEPKKPQIQLSEFTKPKNSEAIRIDSNHITDKEESDINNKEATKSELKLTTYVKSENSWFHDIGRKDLETETKLFETSEIKAIYGRRAETTLSRTLTVDNSMELNGGENSKVTSSEEDTATLSQVIETDELVTIKHQITKSIDVSTTKIQDSSEKQIELTNGRKTTGTENTKSIISKTNKDCEYDSCKAISPSTNNHDQTSGSSASEFEQFEDSESRNIKFQTLEYSDKKERFQNEKETNTDSKSRADLSNTFAKIHPRNVFRDEPDRYQANTFLGTDAIGSKGIILDDKGETKLKASIPDQMAHDLETVLPTSKANKAKATELPKTQTDETESSEGNKFLKDTQEYEFDHATFADLRTEDIKTTTVSETTKINNKSTEGDKDENTRAFASKAKKYQASGTDKLEINENKFVQITQAEAGSSEPHSGNYPSEEFGDSTSEFRKTVAASKTELKAPKGNLPRTTERKSNQKEKARNFTANEHETNKISHPKTKELETTEEIFSNEKKVTFFKTVDSDENLSSTKSVPIESIKPIIDNEKIRTQTRETTELKDNKIEMSLTSSKDNSVVLPTGPQIPAFNIQRKARMGRETEYKINKIENSGPSKYQLIKSWGIKLKPELRGVDDAKNTESKATEARNIKVLEQVTATNAASKTLLKEKELKKDKPILAAIPRKPIGPPRPNDIKLSKTSNVREHVTQFFNDNSDSIELKTGIRHTKENEHYRLAASAY